MPYVAVESLHKRFGSLDVIKGVDLDIAKGEFCALLGPSGCGKSTLLRMIAGLEDVSSGRISIDGRDVTMLEPAERRIAMVFQSYALYPHMTVAENIAFSLEVASVPKAERRTRALEVAKLLQLDELMDRRPAALSGGQRQRVAIGRALLRDPKVFLFDEPLSNLDAILRVQMRIELSNLHQELGATMIYVTHDQVEAMTMADRIVVLNEGRICQVGEPLELYEHPANKFVASFIGSPSMSFIKTQCLAQTGNSIQLQFTGLKSPLDIPCQTQNPVAANSTVDLGIRPEHCTLNTPDAGHVSGEVQLVERLGNQTVVHIKTEAGVITHQGAGHLQVKKGDRVGATIIIEKARAFDDTGSVI